MVEYIDRAVVKKHLDECAADDTILRDYRDACIALSVYVEMLPAADVQPVKHGKWIYVGSVRSWDEIKCSACDSAFSTEDRDLILNWDFCPNCGADMRGEDNAESKR